MGQAAFRVWLHRARSALFLAATLSCDPKGTDYFLTAESTIKIGGLTGLVSVGTTPINGATITLTGPESRSTTTGTTGNYTFADLTPGTYTVTATVTNFNCPPGSATIVAFQTTTRNIACTPQPGTINGTVRVDLTPVAGVSITAQQGTNTVGTATTGSDGTYTIPNLLPGAYTIAMTPPANTICPTTQRDVTVQSNLTTTADFDCTTAPGSVAGTVRVDGAGQSGVTVTLAQGSTTIGTATTGAGGTYTIANVPPGAYTASITPPAGTVCVANSQSVTVQANAAATADFDCTIPRGAVTGVVRVNSVGQSGVAVTVTQGTTTIGSATTGAGGAYTISNVQPGTYTVTITPPVGTTCTTNPQQVTVQSNQAAVANFDCTPQPGTVSGTVRLDLAPLAGVTITARQGTNTVGTTTTASDGTYTIPNLPPGAYTIAMTPPSNTVCPITQRNVTVQSNVTTTADFDCTTAPGSVAGTVRVDGAGQSGVTVTLAQGSTTIGTATTGASGTYTIANVPPGAYTASITPPAGTVCVANSQSVTVQANAAATADFDCTIPRGAVNGVVRVNSVGQSGVAVTVTQGTTTIGSATTGAGGAYTISNVQPGTYTVTITPPVGTTCTTNPQQVTVQSNQAAVANFDCTPQPGTVSGTVRLDLAPLAGVTITAQQGTNTVGTTTTASDGTYTIPNLPPGAYTISMTPPSNTICPTTQRNVTVQSNLTTTADFDCTTAPGSVAGTVRVDGTGQSGVTVTLAQGATTIGTATTGAGGTYTIANVAPGVYTASITPPAGTVCVANSQSVTVQANAGATADFDCTIPRGAVNGVVRVNSVGQSGVAVTVTQGTTTIGSATTGAGGAYTISNVQPGTYTVTITTPLGATCSTNPQQVTVQSNQTAVANFDCINFTVTLTNPSPSYRQISGTSYETCTGITTTPAQPGGTWTATWTGTDTVGGTTRTGTLSGTGTAVDRQPITFSGTSTTYTVAVTVTSAGATRSATGSVTVDTTAGTCPP